MNLPVQGARPAETLSAWKDHPTTQDNHLRPDNEVQGADSRIKQAAKEKNPSHDALSRNDERGVSSHLMETILGRHHEKAADRQAAAGLATQSQAQKAGQTAADQLREAMDYEQDGEKGQVSTMMERIMSGRMEQMEARQNGDPGQASDVYTGKHAAENLKEAMEFDITTADESKGMVSDLMQATVDKAMEKIEQRNQMGLGQVDLRDAGFNAARHAAKNLKEAMEFDINTADESRGMASDLMKATVEKAMEKIEQRNQMGPEQVDLRDAGFNAARHAAKNLKEAMEFNVAEADKHQGASSQLLDSVKDRLTEDVQSAGAPSDPTAGGYGGPVDITA